MPFSLRTRRIARQADNGDLGGAEKQWTVAVDIYENGGADAVVLSPQVLQPRNPQHSTLNTKP